MDLDDEWALFQESSNNFVDTKKTKIIKKNEEKHIPKCSDIYISTQTKIGYLSNTINLNKIFWVLPVIPYYIQKEGIIKKSMKINSLTRESVKILEEKIKNTENINTHIISQVDNPNARKIKFKDVRKIDVGLSKKDLISYRRKIKGAFYNCFAVILRIFINNSFKEIHVKIFNTGKLEIPGIQDDHTLKKTLDLLVNILNNYCHEKISWEPSNIDTVLINSNFNAGFYIKRFDLYVLLKNKYKINSNYDPCSYPGIQCKFYYHPDSKKHDGIYDNKNTELKLNLWKSVSFMIFRTGSILIVGNCDEKVLNIIYKYLVNILHTEYNNISIKNNVEVKKKPIKKQKRKTIIFDKSI